MVKFLKDAFYGGMVSTISGVVLLIAGWYLSNLSKTKSTINFFGATLDASNSASFILVLGITYFVLGGIIWLLSAIFKK